MTDLNKYKNDLEQLKTKKTEIDLKINSAKEMANQLKEELSKRGYSSLEEAKNDFIKKSQDIETKHTQILSLIEQIKVVEADVPSKELILNSLREEIRKSSLENKEQNKDQTNEETKEEIKEEIKEEPKINIFDPLPESSQPNVTPEPTKEVEITPNQSGGMFDTMFQSSLL